MAQDRDRQAGFDGLSRPGNGDWDAFHRGQEQRRHEDYRRAAQQQGLSQVPSNLGGGAYNAGGAIGDVLASWYLGLSLERRARAKRVALITVCTIAAAIVCWLGVLRLNDAIKWRLNSAREAAVSAARKRDEALHMEDEPFAKLVLATVNLPPPGSRSEGSTPRLSYFGTATIAGRPVDISLNLQAGGSFQQRGCFDGSAEAIAADDATGGTFQSYFGTWCDARIVEVMNNRLKWRR